MKCSQSVSFLFAILVIQFALISQTTASPTVDDLEHSETQVDLPKVNSPVVIDAFVPNSTLSLVNSDKSLSLILVCPFCYQILCILQQLQLELNCANLLELYQTCQAYDQAALLTIVANICVALNLDAKFVVIAVKDVQTQSVSTNLSLEVDSVAVAGQRTCTTGCLTLGNILDFLLDLCITSCHIPTLENLLASDLQALCKTSCCCGLLG